MSNCPICDMADGFHNHSHVVVPAEHIKPKGWLSNVDCPLCMGVHLTENVSLEGSQLCEYHLKFIEALDEMLIENQEVLGRLAVRERLELVESLGQMERGEGRVVRSEELRGEHDHDQVTEE